MKRLSYVPVLLIIVMCWSPPILSENIDPDYDDSQYAFSENTGWLNWEPNNGFGVQVDDYQLSGYIWGENIGWINLRPSLYGGVDNDGSGSLSGFAWGENVGWINFAPAGGGISIDPDGSITRLGLG